MEIKINEFLGMVATRYRDADRDEVLIKQWAYEALGIMSEGEGFQEITWKWENDGTWTNTYIAVPNDIREVKEITINGSIGIKVYRNNKDMLASYEYYEQGPYLHFAAVPQKIEAIVERIKTDVDGDMVMEESDALAVLSYVLWQVQHVAFEINEDPRKHAMLREKMQMREKEWLTYRRQARGDFNSKKESDQYLAQIEWNNMYNSIRPSW